VLIHTLDLRRLFELKRIGCSEEDFGFVTLILVLTTPSAGVYVFVESVTLVVVSAGQFYTDALAQPEVEQSIDPVGVEFP